jgi:DnaK suppressor protein
MAYWPSVRLPPPSFARDRATAEYHDQRAPGAPAPVPAETGADGDDSALRDRLDAERASTLARLEAMTAEHDGIVAASMDTNADDEHDPEGSTIAFERARVAALVAQARAHLDDLDRAVARLDHGTYAVCEHCGSEIAAERLSARPATRTCIRCAPIPPTP